MRASSAESLQYVGRTWKASPSEGYPTAHQVEQDRIVRTALGARRRGPRLHCGVARETSERINGEPMAVDTSIPENPFTTDASAEDDASSLAARSRSTSI